jgi:hypothetical protein
MGSDDEWQAWGERDPYFGVLAHQRFRRGQLTAAARAEFFASGREDLAAALAGCRTHLGECSLERTLDFGCGVGRVLIPLALAQCVGVDSRRQCAEAALSAAGCSNMTLVKELGERRGGRLYLHPLSVDLRGERGARAAPHPGPCWRAWTRVWRAARHHARARRGASGRAAARRVLRRSRARWSSWRAACAAASRGCR